MTADTIATGRYRVRRVLGAGAMAKVVLAEDAELERLVAVKVLDERLASDESFRARFSREARLAAALSHPNVVGVFDVGEADGMPFIVMEYVEGRTLEDRLRDEGALPPNDVRAIARQVCAGLAHAHATGLVHRDLKPGNLMERSDAVIKIADFGVARASEATELTEAGTIIGTAAYLAPEQAEGGTVTSAADMYAFGVVVYELLVGKRPWEVRSLTDLAERRSAIAPELPRHVPADLRELVSRCLAPDATNRPSAPQAAGLLGRPEPATETETATVVLRPSRRAAAPGARRRLAAPLLAVLAALLLVAAAGIAVLARDGRDPVEPPAEPAPAAQVEPIPPGETPAEDARNLAEWLRENSRGG